MSNKPDVLEQLKSVPIELELVRSRLCNLTCLYIKRLDSDYAYRIAGSKPWGGGEVVAHWEVDPDNLLKALQAIKEEMMV